MCIRDRDDILCFNTQAFWQYQYSGVQKHARNAVRWTHPGHLSSLAVESNPAWFFSSESHRLQVSYYRPYYVSSAAEFASSPIARSNLILSSDECVVVFMILQPVQYIQLTLAWQRKYQTEPIKSTWFEWYNQTTLVLHFHNTMPSITFSLPNNVFGFMF